MEYFSSNLVKKNKNKRMLIREVPLSLGLVKLY